MKSQLEAKQKNLYDFETSVSFFWVSKACKLPYFVYDKC